MHPIGRSCFLLTLSTQMLVCPTLSLSSKRQQEPGTFFWFLASLLLLLTGPHCHLYPSWGLGIAALWVSSGVSSAAALAGWWAPAMYMT